MSGIACQPAAIGAKLLYQSMLEGDLFAPEDLIDPGRKPGRAVSDEVLQPLPDFLVEYLLAGTHGPPLLFREIMRQLGMDQLKGPAIFIVRQRPKDVRA